MNNYNVVMEIDDNKKWYHLLERIENLKKFPEVSENVNVIASDTAVLSYLNNTELECIRTQMEKLSEKNVHFFICTNTLKKYGIARERLLPFVKVAEQGAIVEVLKLQDDGYKYIKI